MIYLGADRHGFGAILAIQNNLRRDSIEFVNLGVKDASQDMRLEDLIPPIVARVISEPESSAILSCGTGVGVEVGANKFAGIRACLATNEKIASWARIYDMCNVLCLSGWLSSEAECVAILKAWLESSYDGSEARLRMFQAFDNWH